MANFCIITNNPLVRAKFPEVCQFAEQDVAGIFTLARDHVHQGARLITHPLAGSVKPNESPYKSLALSGRGEGLDFGSLELMENAMAALKKLPVKHCAYGPEVLADFRVIDLDLLDSAISALPAAYHL